MDQEVAKTLGLLELKLQELERELTTIGRRGSMPITETVRGPVEEDDTPVEQRASASETNAFALVDEAAVQPHPSPPTGEDPSDPRFYEATIEESEKFGAPAMFGGEEVPSQASPAPARDWGLPRETAYGEIPTAPGDPSALRPEDTPATAFTASPPSPPSPHTPPPPPPPSSSPSPSPPPSPPFSIPAPHPSPPAHERPIERADLIAFRDKLTRTLDELIEEYDRLLAGRQDDRPGL